MRKAVEIVEFRDQFIDATMNLFERWSPDHPEIARREQLRWQRCKRWVSTFQGNIVGHISVISQKFLLNGQRIKVGWAATLVLDESNPIVQIFSGTGLLDQVCNYPNHLFGAVGVVPEIERTHQRRGFVVDKESIRMYGRFLRPSKTLKYQGVSTAFAPVVSVGNAMFRPRRLDKASCVKQTDSFESKWDESWNQILRENFAAYGERAAEYLNYKLSQPGKHYTILLNMKDKHTPDGYLIYRVATHNTKDLRLFKICDLVGTKKAKQNLLAKAMVKASELDVDGIIALSSATDKKMYRSAGLWISRRYTVVTSPQIDVRLHLTFFDSDLDDLW